MRQALFVVIASGVLSGCGSAKQAFDESFDKSFRESCVSAATAKGVAMPVADQTCGCAVRKINERFDATEKATLGDDKLRPILNECVKSVVQNNG
jgi:hypothetical protein